MLRIVRQTIQFRDLTLKVRLALECLVICVHIAEENITMTSSHSEVIVETIGACSQLLVQLKRNVELHVYF